MVLLRSHRFLVATFPENGSVVFLAQAEGAEGLGIKVNNDPQGQKARQFAVMNANDRAVGPNVRAVSPPRPMALGR